MNSTLHKAWRQYEAGKAYKRRIGLYETTRKNESFYRGEQWQSGEANGLPKPIFNIIHRVIDYLVCSVASADLSIRFSDDNLPFVSSEDAKTTRILLDTLTKNAAYRWGKCDMDAKLIELLTDAAISGDGALYCYWDENATGAGDYTGDIVTMVADSSCIYPADVNLRDIQSQEYIILSGRSTVSSLRCEAECFGVAPDDIAKITADNETSFTAGYRGSFELEGDDESKTTFIVKFWKEDGKVCFEKSTRECIIKRAKTDCSLYPIAFFNWISTKNSFHGTSPITGMIPNQKFINRAYSMAMKHMTDTAFSKVIYDKTKIPEWSNEVGEAIAAIGGGNVSDAVSIVGTGKMQEGFMEVLDSAVKLTKELMGATESALGNIEANNTSAILALQESSRITLDNVRVAYYKCVEDMASIWADMMCAYYPSDRLIPCCEGKDVIARQLDTSALRRSMLSAHIDVAEITRYSAVNAQNMLDKLLDGGHITPTEYIKRLPAGLLMDRQALIDEIDARTKLNNTEEEKYE